MVSYPPTCPADIDTVYHSQHAVTKKSVSEDQRVEVLEILEMEEWET